MNWIAAYINAVKTNLPRSKRDDVGEELQDLLEQSLEMETGKSPGDTSDDEMLAWLKTREHPALIASRYHDRRVLISEDCYPLFKLTLRYALIGLAVVFTGLAILTGFSSGDYTFSIAQLIGSIIHNGLLAFASITLFFHFFGHQFSSKRFLENWNPKDLPNPDQKWEQEPWADSICGLVFTGIFLLFINGFLGGITQALAGERLQGVQINIVTELSAMLPWINAVLIGSILLYGVMIIKPYWTTTTLSMNIILSAAVALIAYQLQSVSPLVEITGAAPENADGVAKLTSLVNTSLRVAIYFILAVSLYEIARDAWRIIRLGNRRPV